MQQDCLCLTNGISPSTHYSSYPTATSFFTPRLFIRSFPRSWRNPLSLFSDLPSHYEEKSRITPGNKQADDDGKLHFTIPVISIIFVLSSNQSALFYDFSLTVRDTGIHWCTSYYTQHSLPLIAPSGFSLPKIRDSFQSKFSCSTGCNARKTAAHNVTLFFCLNYQALRCWTKSDLILSSHEANVIGVWFDSTNQRPGLVILWIEIHTDMDMG